jgi:hypothetical protein
MVNGSPELDLNNTDALAHTYINLTVTAKAGLYMTMYYTPKMTQFY